MTLLSAHLHLTCSTPDRLPPWTGGLAQAWFLEWVRSVQPELAAQLHDSIDRKPYTISALTESSDVYPNGYTLRLTTFSRAATAAISVLLTEHPPRQIRLGKLNFDMIQLHIEHSDYDALVRQATESPVWLNLHFHSPTTFRSNRLEVPLPLPSLVFGSLIHAWDTFSALPLPLHLGDFIRNQVVLSRHQVATQRVAYSKHRSHVGFTGRVQFAIRALPAGVPTVLSQAEQTSAVRLLGALSRYAYFAGVGIRTAAGMGQTLPLDHW